MLFSSENSVSYFLLPFECRRALLAQHESRRGEFMANFGSFQTSLTLGRKALQKIQHYELRLKKEKMHGWVRQGKTLHKHSTVC